MLVNGKEIKVTAELIQVKNGDCKSHEYKIQCKYTSMFTPPTHPFSMKIGTVMIRCMCLGSNQGLNFWCKNMICIEGYYCYCHKKQSVIKTAVPIRAVILKILNQILLRNLKNMNAHYMCLLTD
jgi:hypothetical protein